ncbi:MAG: Fic family protein [Alkaliphilus sp.]
MAANEREDHPWKLMNDLELLKSVGLCLKDPQSGKEGITLDGILIFGSEVLIQAALPHYKTDAILRRVDLDRYDDRDDIRVNLIESFERLIQFVSKHLNDNFYLEGDRRISLRDKIFREVISNLLIHREFANPFQAKFVIEKGRVFVENSNKPHGNGTIDPDNFSPFPKNPTIAKFFKEIGWVDELGPGVRNIYKYNKIYSGAEPTFIEGDVFKTIIPLTSQVDIQDTTQADEEIKNLLEFCKSPRTRSEMQKFMKLSNREHFRKIILKPLINGELLKLTIPDKPTSPKQKYYCDKN